MSLYDDLAGSYAKHTMHSVFNAGYERPAVQGILGDVQGKRVLDAGCASGELTRLLLARGANVVGIDRSEALLKIARERTGAAAELHCADISSELAFLQDGTFDAVVSSLTLHYLQSWDVPLREFFRVLRPGGTFVMSTHHPAMTAEMVEDYFAIALVEETWHIDDRDVRVSFYHRPLEAITTSMTAAGFSIVRIDEPHLIAPGFVTTELDRRRLTLRPWFLIVAATKG